MVNSRPRDEHTGTPAWRTLRANDGASTEWLHSGIAVLESGHVVYGALGGGAIIFEDERHGTVHTIELPVSAAHGITAAPHPGGERLWIADPGPDGGTGQVLEISVSGTIHTRISAPPTDGADVGWRPTSVVVDPTDDGDIIWIADGYGGDRVYRLAPDGGVVVIDAADRIPFDCPHGITMDDRADTRTIVVADRGNRRLVFLNLDGSVHRVVADRGMTSPSCIAVRGDALVVTDLFGQVLTIGMDDDVEVRTSFLPDPGQPGWPNRIVDGRLVAPLLTDGEVNSPHGVAVGREGDVYLTEWVLGGRVECLRWPVGADLVGARMRG